VTAVYRKAREERADERVEREDEVAREEEREGEEGRSAGARPGGVADGAHHSGTSTSGIEPVS